MAKFKEGGSWTWSPPLVSSSIVILCPLLVILLLPSPLHGYGGYLSRVSVPWTMPGPIFQYRPPTFNYQPRHFSLPSMSKVSETLGALNSIGRYLLKKTNSNSMAETATTHRPYHYGHHHNGQSGTSNESDESDEMYVGAASSQNVDKISTPPFKVAPEEDEQLSSALYTLGRNVLGKNVTDTLVPVMQTVNTIGKFLPPLIYRDGRIILGSSSNATKDGGSIKDVVCTTPSGNAGKCLDLSGCPSLLFDLSNLRKSLCFKALFVPGVCCPDRPDRPTKNPPPIEVITTSRPSIGDENTRPPIIIDTSTRRPKPTFPDIGLPSNHECGKAETPSFRIVGGEKSTPGMWPWMAAIFLHGPKGTEFWCGGTLISKRYILTAAHCTKDQKQKSFSPRQFTVRLGDYDLVKTDDVSSPETFRVTEIIAHKEFSGVGFYNDVALLKLEKDVEYSRFISPICLPTGRTRANNFVGTYPTVIGWGTNKYGGREHSALQEVRLPVWSNADCDRAYFQPITDIFLCAGIPAGGKDACQGDSGGPLMLEMDGRWVQIGLVSFGNRCAEPGYPGVYTRITSFLDFIHKNAI